MILIAHYLQFFGYLFYKIYGKGKTGEYFEEDECIFIFLK